MIKNRKHNLVTTRAYHYACLMRLNRPVGIYLLLWPTLAALWLASEGAPHVKNVIIFTLGTIIMRSAGCVINDIADRNLDGRVARTRHRPLPEKKVTLVEAIGLVFVLLGAALFLVWQTNFSTILLACAGLGIVIIYPFMKRFTHWPQLILSVAFAWGIPMAFAAETNAVPMVAWVFFLMTAIWIMAYDTMYAMADRPDDILIGVKSTAILFGRADKFIIGCLQSVMMLLLFFIGGWLHFSWIYYAMLFVILSLFVYQQFLLHSDSRDAYLNAFLNNHWVGMALFLGVMLAY